MGMELAAKGPLIVPWSTDAMMTVKTKPGNEMHLPPAAYELHVIASRQVDGSCSNNQYFAPRGTRATPLRSLSPSSSRYFACSVNFFLIPCHEPCEIYASTNYKVGVVK